MAGKYLNIRRIDNDTTHAWRVVVRRRYKMHRQLFSDGVHGGKRKALQKAKAYRDELIEKYQPMTRKQFVSIKRKNNRSGVPGVFRYTDTYTQADGKTVYHYYWAARWTPAPGKRKQVKFEVDKYGEEGAFKKACAERRRAMKRTEGYYLPRGKIPASQR